MKDTDIIGKVQAIYDGETREFDVFRDGSLILPDGTKHYIDEDSLADLLKTEKARYHASGESLAKSTITPPNRAIKPKKIHDEAEFLALKAERKKMKQRMMLLTAALALILLGIAVTLGVIYRPYIGGALTNQYRVAVINRDVSAGDTIQDADISFTEISSDEYATLCNNHYVDDNGTLVRDAPVFFVNRAKDAVSQFASADLIAGSVLMRSGVTAQKREEDVYVVDTVNAQGDEEQVSIDANAFDGDVTVQYVAVITTAEGNTYQIPMSTLRLRNRTLQDILDATGSSLLETTPAAEKE